MHGQQYLTEANPLDFECLTKANIEKEKWANSQDADTHHQVNKILHFM